MPEEPPIRSKRLSFKRLNPENVTDRYLAWMNDYEVVKFLESRFSPPKSLEELKEYVRRTNSDQDQLLFAIIHEEDHRHIGNIKIGPINRTHRHASIGIIIGEREYWGQGYASEAIGRMTQYAFEFLGLNHVFAGCYHENVASAKAFLKAGWKLEGTQVGHYLFEGRFVDGLLFGKSRQR